MTVRQQKSLKYLGIVHSDDKPGYGISFPDFPGCISAADTLDELMDMGIEALTGHIECMLENGLPIPPPRTQAEFESDPEYADWTEDMFKIVHIPVAMNITQAAE